MLEILLRLQQKLGPIYDLEFNDIDVTNLMNDSLRYKDLAAEDLRKNFKDTPGKYYFPEGPHSHFNFEGTQIYSNLVAEKLSPMIIDLTNRH